MRTVKWLAVLVSGVAALAVLSSLLIGCSNKAEEVLAPDVPLVEDEVDVDKEDPPGLCVFVKHEETSADSLPHDNLEPVFIVPRYDEIVMQWLLEMQHCEDHGLEVDHGLGPSPPDSSGSN